jgi:hypothetical protein
MYAHVYDLRPEIKATGFKKLMANRLLPDRFFAVVIVDGELIWATDKMSSPCWCSNLLMWVSNALYQERIKSSGRFPDPSDLRQQSRSSCFDPTSFLDTGITSWENAPVNLLTSSRVVCTSNP